MSSGSYTDARTTERIRAHYEVERELADRLRNAPREERRALYSLVYDELFRTIRSICTPRTHLSSCATSFAPWRRVPATCITPNRLNGPHDDSSHFDREATGFHVKEYTVTELARLFRAAGFAKARANAQARGRAAPVPGPLLAGIEGAINTLPFGARRQLADALPWRWALGIQIIGYKGR